MADHSPKELEYNYIDEGIFVGTNVCCKTHFDEKLGGEGITTDVSLEYDRIDQPFGVESYTWIPVKNGTPPAMDQLEFGVAVLEKIVELGKKVYVHCQNGHGRAPTLVSAYFIKTKKMGPNEVESFMKSKRPTIHLEDIQRQALRDFYEKWK